MAGFTSIDSEPDDDVISTINIVPFVDIVLVLLVIFMLTSVTIVKASLTVDLPRAASAGSSVTSTLNVVLTRDGALFLNGSPTSKRHLRAWVRQQTRRLPKLRAVISADKHCDYGAVIDVIDLIKQNGVKSFALNIERAPKPSAGPGQ